jgi:hypothetical protein
MIAYFGYLLKAVINKSNPQITESTLLNNFDYKYVVNIKELGFKFAWGVESVYGSEPKQDLN